jgi:hypothetical protein
MIKTIIGILLFSSLCITSLYSQNILVPYRDGNKWGVKSYETQIVIIKPKYKSIGAFLYNRAVFQKGKKYGYLDEQGKEVIKAKYTSASDFGCYGLAKVQIRGRIEIITTNGEVSNSRPFDCGGNNSSMFYGYSFQQNGKYGFARSVGDTIIPAQYDEIRVPHYYQQPAEWHFIVRQGKYWGIVTQANIVVLPCEYDDITDKFETGSSFAVLEKNDKYGAYSFKTGVLIPADYFSIFAYNKFVRVEISTGVVLVDKVRVLLKLIY